MAADTEYWQNILFNICTRSTLQLTTARQSLKLQYVTLETFLQAKNFDNLWEVHVRRGVLLKILEEWINVYRDDAVVDVLLEALSTPGFMDVKLRDAVH